MKRLRVRSRSNGASLVELMIVAMLMSFTMAGVLQMLAAMTLSSSRLTNKADSIAALNWYSSYLGPDIRQAISISVNSSGKELTLLVPVYTNEFPSALTTVTYSVKPNPTATDEFLMDRTINSGSSQVILKGIVGPKDTSGQVSTFKYKTNPNGFPGASVDIDLKTPGSTTTAAQGLGVHNEWYLRSARYSN